LKGENCLQADRICMFITCEHGGNSVPKDFAALFYKARKLLEGHRGYDAGALQLARKFAEELKAPLFFSKVTRLLIDLNRSPDNPGRFSEITKALSAEEKAAIENRYYTPYRGGVQSAFARCIEKRGLVRIADIGLLYDPSRKNEAAFCVSWQEALHRLQPDVKIRRNYPYRGKSDGFTTHLRRSFPERSYLGIELEVNQKILRNGAAWLKLRQALLQSLLTTLKPI
jgi:predicted N-formylglutamate amidohydrolase